nr:MAG: hypothetical protein [Bacteriophage sp.]
MSKTRKPPLRLVFGKCPTCDPASKAYLNAGRDWAMKHGTFAMRRSYGMKPTGIKATEKQ